MGGGWSGEAGGGEGGGEGPWWLLSSRYVTGAPATDSPALGPLPGALFDVHYSIPPVPCEVGILFILFLFVDLREKERSLDLWSHVLTHSLVDSRALTGGTEPPALALGTER